MMDVPVGTSPRLRRPKRRFRFVALPVLIVAAVVVAAVWYWLAMPSDQRVAPFDGRQNVILYHGEPFPRPFRVENGEILLPFEFVQSQLDPHLYWDEPTGSVVVTTKDKVLRMESGKLVAFLNKRPVDLRVPVQEADGVRYVPYAPLEKLYPVKVTRHSQTGVLVVEKAGDAVQQGKVLAKSKDSDKASPLPLRTGPADRQPIVADVVPGQIVDVLREEAGWYRVQTSEGIVGYLPKERVALTEVRRVQLPSSEPDVPARWKPLGQKVALVWEHVVKRTPDPSVIPDMPGVNVVSPTWFELIDDKGHLANRADTAYVKWAHGRGYQVWGLVSNGFNPDWTKAALADVRTRENLIAQILEYVHLYELDGINLDFENVYLDDKQRLVQFVRELTPYLHEQGVTVSLDVTVKSNSERWSLFYDRAALAAVVDYVALMAYDEHWASSPKAGSVASLSWTEESLRQTLAEVPREKLLLGIPFYTRLWKEVKQPDGSLKVSSKALSMRQAEDWLRERGVQPKLDEASGQLYASYRDPADQAVYKVWLEEQTSLVKRLELVRKYKLAGIAAWRRGFEKPELWPVIQKGLNGF